MKEINLKISIDGEDKVSKVNKEVKNFDINSK